MPAQTLTSTQRAVLSPRNVNAPITSPSSKMGSKASSVTEQRKLVDVSARNALEEGAMPDAVDQQAGLAGTKRRFDISGGAGSVENKRRKAEGHAEATQSADDLLLGSIDGVLRGAVSEVLSAARAPRSPLPPRKDAVSLPSSATSSPASSNGFSEDVFNDSQLTEPDKSRVIPTLNPVEIRQKAEALKLRLRLASYKVRTNQIDVPMSRLQIRASFDSQRLSTPRLKPRTPLPTSSASPILNIRLQKPSAAKARARQTDLTSSPPPPMHCGAASAASAASDKDLQSPGEEGEDETRREELATPALPRHRQGLLNAIWDEKSPNKELTSSVVKRGTADVLLSLKLQR